MPPKQRQDLLFYCNKTFKVLKKASGFIRSVSYGQSEVRDASVQKCS
jgi:hypothetical protein